MKLMALLPTLEPASLSVDAVPAVLTGCRINRIVDTQQRIRAPRAHIVAAGIGEAWFPEGTDPAEAIALLRRWWPAWPDAACAVQEHVVVDGPCSGIKRMAVLGGPPGADRAGFSGYWRGVHAGLVRRLEGVRRYVQHHRLGDMDAAGEAPVDGFVELWFADVPAMDAAFGSEAGRELAVDAGRFTSHVTTFIVRPETILPPRPGC